MEADHAFAVKALDHARLAAAVAFVPRATIAELAGRTMRRLRQDATALGIPQMGRPVRTTGAKPRRPRVSERRSPDRRSATLATGTRRARRGAGARSTDMVPEAVCSGLAQSTSPIDRLAVGRAMERFIASRIAAYEAAGTDDPEPEKTARTIGHYARALGLVRGYLSDIEKDAETHDEAPSRTLSELRDELRRHLERIWDEDEDAGGLGGAGDDAR